MKIGILEPFSFISIYVLLLYYLNTTDFTNINPTNYLDTNKNIKSYDDIFWDSSLNISMKNRKCFRLFWNLSSLDEMCMDINISKGQNLASVMSKHITSCNRFITLGRSCGRTGNQMFQIASLIGIAYLYDMIPMIPQQMLCRYFSIPNTYDTNQLSIRNSTNCTFIKPAAFQTCKDEWNSTANVTMWGLLQSWKYFDGAKDIVRNIFRLSKQHVNNARQFLMNVTKSGFQHVCIHVRRGDLLRKSYKQYNVPGVGFIKRAMEFYVKTFKNVDFLIVTQDKLWCEENIPGVPISPFTHASDDMALMTLSDHVVVTAGTYGWWGAWLSGGLTVYYKGYPGRNLSNKFNIPDYYPPYWIGL